MNVNAGWEGIDNRDWSVLMKKEVKCGICDKSVTLDFPDEFEGRPIETYEQIRSYVGFLVTCHKDYSHGKFVWNEDGKETWLCPECNKGTVWYA